VKNCILCGKLTNGSVGRAGMNWTKICQKCKDREDAMLADHLERTKSAFDIILDTSQTG
jgi:hypothetical protein